MQVKVRGYRIELDEIEQVLGKHPSVAQAVVHPWLPENEPISNTTLVAYILKKTPSQLGLADMAPKDSDEDGKVRARAYEKVWPPGSLQVEDYVGVHMCVLCLTAALTLCTHFCSD